jgi:hypothetical protein
MEFLPSWFLLVVGLVSFTLYVIQLLAAVRTESHLKKILAVLEGEQSTHFGIAQSLQAIQRNTQPDDKGHEEP